ncbi:MAG: threonine aldolase family protein [Ardenticatenales bacterium]|nr:threonine aldolase family protein [Ardenticatenales bacterium]
MIEGRINLYSDTQTRPSLAMREAMLAAPVGDEQKGMDPSVNQLCALVTDLLGKEAAIFLPSGTMCNEIAILVHCERGDGIYCDQKAHIYISEAGGPAALAGASVHPLTGERGVFTGAELNEAILARSRYTPRARLVSIEQTANFSGGTVWPLATIRGVAETARANKLALHMDGARLMNAVVASGVPAREFCADLDSVWVDLTKGLGCPFGGVLAGSADFIDRAWGWKHRLGGAMRQAGMMAAAGLYAFEHHVERLAEDHGNARRLAQSLSAHDHLALNVDHVETNIVIFDLVDTALTAAAVAARLEEMGLNVSTVGRQRLRAVTHMDVSAAQIDEAGEIILAVVSEMIDAQF